MNRKASELIYTPIQSSTATPLSNRDLTALVLDLPSAHESAWDCAMFMHHQMWLKSNSEEASVVQRWLRFWGWMPRGCGDRCFASFMYCLLKQK